MTTTIGTTIEVFAHFAYRGNADWDARYPDDARPTYGTGIIGWSNPITAKTNGPVVLETNGGMYTDQPYRDAILTPALANHAGMQLVTRGPLYDEDRELFAAALAAGFAISERVY